MHDSIPGCTTTRKRSPLREPSFLSAGTLAALLTIAVLGLTVAVTAGPSHTTSKFAGPKANTGTATHAVENGVDVLTLSDDFVVPQTPAPHWQLVDSKGNTYLLNRLVIKEDKYNQSITVPTHVADLAKVQIWCAWAETLLGEAAFAQPIAMQSSKMASHNVGGRGE